MRAVRHRGSSLPSCRTGRHLESHASVRSTTHVHVCSRNHNAQGAALSIHKEMVPGAPDTACRQRRPPRRCVGWIRRQPHGLKDCHTLCPDTGVGVPPRAVAFDHNGVQGRLQQLGIVHVCSRNHNAQGAALSIHKETALGTSLATVRRVGPNQVPPKRALPMAPSAACHSQSTPSNSSHPSTRAPHIRCKTPVPTHR